MPVVPLFLLILTALFGGATAVSMVIARRARREHRTSFFPYVRESEGIKAVRARIIAVIFLALSGVTIGGWVATQQNPNNILIARDIVAEPEAPSLAQADIALNNAEPALSDAEISPSLVEETESAAVPVSPDLSESPLNSDNTQTLSSAPPTTLLSPANPTIVLATSTPLPTAPAAQAVAIAPAPTATFASGFALVRNVAERALPDGMQIGSVQFTTRINDRYEAVNPQDNFSTQADKVYAVFSTAGMRDGLPVSIIWYYQGQEILRDEYEWQWGSEANTFAYVRPQGSGSYQVELKIGTETIAANGFEVKP